MKLIYLCGKERSYVRNLMILQGLRDIGCEVVDCSDDSPTYVGRFFRSISRFLAAGKADVDAVFVGCLGHYFVPLAAALTRRRIVFDPFVSMYDTLCLDRRRFSPGSPVGRILYRLDWSACRAAGTILLDTDAHIDFFCRVFDLPREKFHRVLVGADEALFYPRERKREETGFRVLYYSSYLPLHGTEQIVHAASLLKRESGVSFTLVGNGPEQQRVRGLARGLGVENITFLDWIPYRDLPDQIAAADLCLGGHFSGIDKARRVIAGKTYQFVAMEKPVILGDSPANREIFTHRKDAFMVTMADPRSLAEGILELRSDAVLRERLAEEGYVTFREKCSTAAVGRELREALLGGG